MGTVYLRGSIWWIGYVGPDGRWHYKSAQTGEREEAQRRLAAIEEQLRAGKRLAQLGPLSVAEWGAQWQERRLARKPKVWNAAHEWSQVERHAWPAMVEGERFSRVRLLDVRPRHALALVRALRSADLAPRTVANIWGTVHKLFEDAVIEELLPGNPLVLPDYERPRRSDSKKFQRAKAIFTRGEAEQLIADGRLDEDRRVLYALTLLTGMREGEVADRRWRDYDAQRESLGCLFVHSSFTRANKVSKETKTGVTREVPVHPTLAAMLAQWKLTGFEETYGRRPRPDDFIVLSPRGKQHTDQSILDGLKVDLVALGLRHRRFHDMRRTFITLARADGAIKDLLKWVTRGKGVDVDDEYVTPPWETLCEQVAKLKLGRRNRKAERSLTTRGTTF